ncbi:hypothetical protein HDU76_009683 [Blyttiomyces sp. JEL0837]|nr:hypothetical protein HDU76_009683 [Blyttiomyces sp. JEL0837]
MTISWLTPLDNHGHFICSMKASRHSASLLFSDNDDSTASSDGMPSNSQTTRPRFVLNVPVAGMEDLIVKIGGVSGSTGCDKFDELEIDVCKPGWKTDPNESATLNQQPSQQTATSQTESNKDNNIEIRPKKRKQNNQQLSETQNPLHPYPAIAITNCVAHLVCSVDERQERHGHFVLSCTIDEGYVRSSSTKLGGRQRDEPSLEINKQANLESDIDQSINSEIGLTRRQTHVNALLDRLYEPFQVNSLTLEFVDPVLRKEFRLQNNTRLLDRTKKQSVAVCIRYAMLMWSGGAVISLLPIMIHVANGSKTLFTFLLLYMERITGLLYFAAGAGIYAGQDYLDSYFIDSEAQRNHFNSEIKLMFIVTFSAGFRIVGMDPVDFLISGIAVQAVGTLADIYVSNLKASEDLTPIAANMSALLLAIPPCYLCRIAELQVFLLEKAIMGIRKSMALSSECVSELTPNGLLEEISRESGVSATSHRENSTGNMHEAILRRVRAWLASDYADLTPARRLLIIKTSAASSDLGYETGGSDDTATIFVVMTYLILIVSSGGPYLDLCMFSTLFVIVAITHTVYLQLEFIQSCNAQMT